MIQGVLLGKTSANCISLSRAPSRRRQYAVGAATHTMPRKLRRRPLSVVTLQQLPACSCQGGGSHTEPGVGIHATLPIYDDDAIYSGLDEDAR